MDYKAHMKIKNFNLYYGKHQVVKNINPEIPDKKNKGLHTDIMDIRKKIALSSIRKAAQEDVQIINVWKLLIYLM